MGAVAAEGLVLALRPGMPAVPLPEGCFFLDVSPQSPADIDGAKEACLRAVMTSTRSAAIPC